MNAAAAVASEALTQRLMSLNPKLVDWVETYVLDEPLHMFGVDSLLAVEFRTWFTQNFAADVPIFEILSDRSLEGMGRYVVEESVLWS